MSASTTNTGPALLTGPCLYKICLGDSTAQAACSSGFEMCTVGQQNSTSYLDQTVQTCNYRVALDATNTTLSSCTYQYLTGMVSEQADGQWVISDSVSTLPIPLKTYASGTGSASFLTASDTLVYQHFFTQAAVASGSASASGSGASGSGVGGAGAGIGDASASMTSASAPASSASMASAARPSGPAVGGVVGAASSGASAGTGRAASATSGAGGAVNSAASRAASGAAGGVTGLARSATAAAGGAVRSATGAGGAATSAATSAARSATTSSASRLGAGLPSVRSVLLSAMAVSLVALVAV